MLLSVPPIHFRPLVHVLPISLNVLCWYRCQSKYWIFNNCTGDIILIVAVGARPLSSIKTKEGFYFPNYFVDLGFTHKFVQVIYSLCSLQYVTHIYHFIVSRISSVIQSMSDRLQLGKRGLRDFFSRKDLWIVCISQMLSLILFGTKSAKLSKVIIFLRRGQWYFPESKSNSQINHLDFLTH